MHDVDKFIAIYQQLNKRNLALLDDIYHSDIRFTDPLHEVKGLANLHVYFANLYSNVTECHFDIADSFTSDDHAFVYWTMVYRHPKLAGHKKIVVNGHSHLVFEKSKIISHRDYFDVGSLLYRHIPVLGSIVKLIDKRAAQ
ncbi:MAG: nuclear transport factor 2 family protein [Pseudoalteromonas sp.]|uniref:nuclear transport factor 2 family protein n=1 Tax=unclassified Pseudoalteromonas TaxID=194690 RepID=UPI003F9B3236